MKIAVLTIDDVASGLFRTQVVNVARSLSGLNRNLEIRIFAVNRAWKIRDHLESLRYLRRTLSSSKVSITYIPLLPPLRWSVGSPFLSEILVWILRVSAFFIKLSWPANVWHVRGYWAAIAIQRNGNANMIFDPRSLWIQENQSAGNLLVGDRPSIYWFANEKAVVLNSAHITVVSEGMRRYFINQYFDCSVSVVPISADSKFFTPDLSARKTRREELGWIENIVYVYSGSLGLSGINSKALVTLFRYILSDPRSRILLLSEESVLKINRLMGMVTDNLDQYTVIRPLPEDIPGWLSSADAGLHALPKQLDSDTRLGTKVIECWAVGLPMVVNTNVGAACDYIRQNSYLGVILEFEGIIQPIEKVSKFIKSTSASAIRSFALANFSDHVVSASYLKCYHSVATE